ncbi:MAG: DNA polymerase III subunit delta [Armatimonadota bacterium]
MASSARKPEADIPPVLLITGPDHGMKMRRVEELRAALVDEEWVAFDCVHIDGRSASAADIIAATQVVPVASKRRLVVVRAVERLRPPEAQRLAELLPLLVPQSGSLPTACLVLMTDEEDTERHRQVATVLEKAVKQCGHVLELKPTRNIREIVQRLASEMGIRISAEAAEALAQRSGTDTDVLVAELQKLHNYAGGGQVTPAHVNEAAAATAEYSIFALTDAVGRRDRPGALKCLHALLASGASPYMVLPMLARQFRLLWQAKLVAERKPLTETTLRSLPADIKALLPRDPDISRMAWRAQELARESAAFSWDDLERCLRLVFDADLRIKGIEEGAEDHKAVLETLVVKLCTRSSGVQNRVKPLHQP